MLFRSVSPQLGNYLANLGEGTAGGNIAVSNGSGLGVSANVDLKMTTVPPGQYGNANTVGSFVVTRDGRLTDAGNVSINRSYYLTSNKPSVNLKFSGDVTGTANLNLANENTNALDVSLTIAQDSVALGTDTTGNYTKHLLPGTSITVTGAIDEGNVITVNHADTSTLSGIQGGTGISSITVDDQGHVTAVATATYCTSIPAVTQQFGKTNETIFSCTQTTVGSLTTSNPNFIVGTEAGCVITSGGFNTFLGACAGRLITSGSRRSEEHTSELQSH